MADVDTAPPTDVDVKEDLREQPVVPHAAETDPETHTQAVTYELDADERVEREAAAVYKVISEAMRDGRRIFSFSLDNVHAIFQAVDADHDGLIDYPEFAEAMHQLDLGLSTQQMKDIFAFTDVDNSGAIDYAESVVLEAVASDPTEQRLLKVLERLPARRLLQRERDKQARAVEDAQALERVRRRRR